MSAWETSGKSADHLLRAIYILFPNKYTQIQLKTMWVDTIIIFLTFLFSAGQNWRQDSRENNPKPMKRPHWPPGRSLAYIIAMSAAHTVACAMVGLYYSIIHIEICLADGERAPKNKKRQPVAEIDQEPCDNDCFMNYTGFKHGSPSHDEYPVVELKPFQDPAIREIFEFQVRLK